MIFLRIIAKLIALSQNKFIDGWKLKILLKDDNVFVYDLRDKTTYENMHILGSWNIDPIQIKDVINKQSKKSIAIIFCDRERTFLPIVTWARKNNKAKTFVIRNFNLEKYRNFIYINYSNKN